jgi:hypothetical protein
MMSSQCVVVVGLAKLTHLLIAVGPPPPPPAPIAAPGGRVVANIPPVPPPVMIANPPPPGQVQPQRLAWHRFLVAEEEQYQNEAANLRMAWVNLHNGRGGLTRFLITNIVRRYHYCRGVQINMLSEEKRNAFDPNLTLSVLLHDMLRNGGIEGHLIRGCAGFHQGLAQVSYDVLFIVIILLNKCPSHLYFFRLVSPYAAMKVGIISIIVYHFGFDQRMEISCGKNSRIFSTSPSDIIGESAVTAL